jgi:LPXTG-site transpeptidase (sortase) family protein
MRYFPWIFMMCVLVLSGCGSPNPQSANEAVQLSQASTDIVPSTTTPTSPQPSATATATLIPSPTATLTATPTVTPSPTPEPSPTETATPEADLAARFSKPVDNFPVGTGNQPLYLQISAIDLYTPVVSVGLDANRVPIVPDHDVAWYNLSAEPGQGDNVVFWGHVLRFRNTPNIPAPFARLKELEEGAEIVLYNAQGEAHHYKVTKQVWATPQQVEYILPQGREMLTFVSCIGDAVINNGEVIDMSNRLITIAEPIL